MEDVRKKFFLTVVIAGAFFSPFLAVVALKNAKQEGRALSDQSIAATAKKDAEDARYQYYLGVAEQRESLKKSMVDAKTQYDRLLEDQPQAIKSNQKTVTQTTTEPVVTRKVTNQPVTTSTSSSKPKSSSKTKTS